MTNLFPQSRFLRPALNSAKLSLIAVMLSTSSLAACQTLPQQQGQAYQNANSHLVRAANFLGQDLMSSQYHRVEPMAVNNGTTNIYTITTPHHNYTAYGSAQARQRIAEIAATAHLREIPTVHAAAKSFKDRTTNLVTTPLRAIRGGKARYADAQANQTNNMGGALKSVSTGFGSVASKLGHGVKEIGVTGARIVTGVGGTQCSGLGCAQKAGEDVWSGFNSLVGKHAAAKRIHARLGTDPYTDNKVLRRQVSRLAYAESYVGTGYKFGVSGAGIPVVSPVATGVGYYNNTEFVAGYEDAHKVRKREKQQMVAWGLDKKTVQKLYKSQTLTHKNRTQFFNIMSRTGNLGQKTKMLNQLVQSGTRYDSESALAVFDYLAHLDSAGKVSAYADTPMNIAVLGGKTLVLPIYGDHVRWNGPVAQITQALSTMNKADPSITAAQIHVLGKVAPSLRSNAQKLGVQVQEITKQ